MDSKSARLGGFRPHPGVTIPLVSDAGALAMGSGADRGEAPPWGRLGARAKPLVRLVGLSISIACALAMGLAALLQIGFEPALDSAGPWRFVAASMVVAALASTLSLLLLRHFGATDLSGSGVDPRLLETVFDNSPSLIYLKDTSSRVLMVNRGYREFYGITQHQAFGSQGHEWLGKENAERLILQDRKVIEEGATAEQEFDLVRPDGSTRSMRSIKFPVFADNGAVIGIGGISTDVTVQKTAERALRSSEERYRRLFEMSPDAIYVHVDDRLIFVNPAALTMFRGHSPDDLLGRLASSLFHPDDVPRLRKMREITRQQETPVSRLIEYRFLRLDGTLFPGEAAGAVVDWDGQTAFMVIVRDMSDRIRAEQAVRESEELYRHLVEMSSDAIYMHKDGRISFINAAGTRLFGARSPEEVVGRHTLDLTHPDYRSMVMDYQALTYDGPTETIVMEQQRLRLDGSEFWAQVAVTPFNWRGERAALVVIRDISEQRRAEEALRQSEERYRALVDRTQGAMIVNNKDRILYANEAAVELYGADSIDDLIGINPIRLVHPEEREDAARRRGQVLNDGLPAPTEERRRLRLDGSAILVECAGIPVTWDGEDCILVEARDITARKKAENDLILARDAAELASRTKSEFLANMSHELRTPLNAVIGFSEIMKSEMMGKLGDGRYLDFVRDIHQSGVHLLQLINDILDISKIEAGKLELHDGVFDARHALDSCLRLIRERADEASVNLVAEIPDEMPCLRADERKVKQVFLNLLSNAVKFTPERGSVRVTAQGDPGNGLSITIADTGIGIAADDIPKVLSPFGQVDSSLSRKYDGTGLGLPLARSLVELHGGQLEIESDVGAGTRVTVRFPAERVVD